MGRKIFVSYKYSDGNVQSLRAGPVSEAVNPTTARDYVDKLQEMLADEHINKGENDNESLAGFKDATIESKLRAKIFDSSITVVMISPGMKNPHIPEADQWIPWEISYSLKEHTREGRTSRSNAVLAVLLPDKTGSYGYFLQGRTCCPTGCRLYMTDRLFQILRENMFNVKAPSRMPCVQQAPVFTGEFSYIPCVTWGEFTPNVNAQLERAVRISERIDDYNVTKVVA